MRVMDGKGSQAAGSWPLDSGAMATIQRQADKRREAGIRGPDVAEV